LASTSAAAEPSYNGRLLSEWLAVFGTTSPAKEAIRAMGTNAIPTLLKWISYERSRSDNFPRAAALPHWRWHTLNPDELAATAPSGFGFLGAAALPAIPELVRLARTSSAPDRADRCAVALAEIGPQAIPSLLSLATNGPPWTRYWAVSGLEYFACKPEGVQTLPVVIRCLGDTEGSYSVDGPAQRILIGMDPSVAIPALINALRSASAQIRREVARYLPAFEEAGDPRLPREIPAMVSALRAAMLDPDHQVRDAATNSLRRMGQWEAPRANQHLQPTPR
jgi:HEAT repeats